VDNNSLPASHIPDGNTGTEDDAPSGIDRVNIRMIEDRYIPVGSYRPLDAALAPDNGIPAADIKGNTGPGTKFE